jgi:hypothetical protein
MRSRRIIVELCVIAMLTVAGAVWADEHVRFPGDVPVVDIYHSGGPIGSLNDDQLVVIPFWRLPESIPSDFNLLDTFDSRALDLPLLVKGVARFRDSLPMSWEARGLGAVPFWFVRLSEFQAATADGLLTIFELASFDSLLKGTANFYQEQNHIFGLHQVSHYTMVASGTLDDGRSFNVLFVEVDLVFVQRQIDFS